MRGIPPCIKKEEFNAKKAHIDTRITSKVAFLKGGPKLTKTIEASVYYTNPVHCIGMVSEEFKWVAREKECLNVEMSRVKK